MGRTTTADVLVDGLARAGAARVFVAPSAPAELRAAAHRRSLEIVDTPDDTAAGVLAAVTGEVGDGPGAMLAGLGDVHGLARGLAHAQRERSPVIVLTDGGPDAGLLEPVVKASLGVEPSSAGHWIAHAANLAMKDPRGPVHLAVGAAVARQAALPVAASCRPSPLPPPETAMLDAVGSALAAASRPVVVTGLECGPDDARWIRSFIETLPAPVLATVKGRGALPEPHPLSLGLLTTGHGVLASADLVVLIGVDHGECPPTAFPSAVRAMRIGRAPWPGDGLLAEALGDLALVIEELAPAVRARAAADWDVAALDRIKRAVHQAAATAPGARLVALARAATPAGTLATGDGPALAAWQAVAPRETLAPMGMAPPGYAVLAAVATQLTQGERRVVAFTTARGLGAGGVALDRAAALGLPIVVVALDALDRAMTARLESAGIRCSTARDEHEFPLAFSAAFMAGRPAVVTVRGSAPPTARPAAGPRQERV
jgi:acetolactate synthase-1/2/3 large subunit